MQLANVSISRPVFATMLSVILIVFGFFSYNKLGIDQFPNVDFPIVTVRVVYPGADPKTIEQKVLDPLEKGLNALESLESLTSTAYPNVGQLVLKFKLERNGDRAAQDVRDKLSVLVSQLPQEAESPVVAKFDVGGAPILTLTLSSDKVPYGELSKLAKDKIKPVIEQVQGVGQVELTGQREREIQVRVSRSKMQSFGMSPLQAVQAIQAQNIDIPSGKVESFENVVRIRTEGTLSSAAQIAQIPISLKTGQKIRVEDIAEVSDTLAKEEGYASSNGRQGIVIVVYKQAGGNTVSMAEITRKKIEELQKTLPEGTELKIFQDNSRFIKGSLDSVKFDLVLGAFLAIVIVLFFLHDWRATLISACAIPVSVIGTFTFISAMNFTLNTMTTLALTLSIGILVDDAIVVIENIYRRLELGESPFVAAAEGTKEIGLAAIAITLSIVAVFVPVAFMEGILGRFFYQFGLTVAFAVILSLFVAFTLTPMMSSRLLKGGHHNAQKPAIFQPIEKFLLYIEEQYRKILTFSLSFPKATVMVGFVVLIISGVLLRFVPVSFFPKEDKSQFSVEYKLQEGTPLSLTKVKGSELEKYLQNYPGVKDVIFSIGANIEKKSNLAKFDVNLVPVKERTFSQSQIVNKLRTDLSKNFKNETDSIEVSEQSGGGGGKPQPIQLILQGADFNQLSGFANETKNWILQNVEGAVDVTTTEPPLVDEIKVITDPLRSSDVGLSTLAVGQSLRALYEGTKAGEIEDKGQRYDVRVLVDEKDAQSLNDIQGISLPNNAGLPILLSSVATLNLQKSPSKIERLGGLKQITVLANFTGQDLNKAVSQIQKYAKEKSPAGISASFEGQAKLLQDAVKAMVGALLLAILLVFIVLCAQFESYLTPLVIMMSVPLAFSGAFLGLLVTQKAMSIYAMIGLIMLMGLVTKNAILLIDFSLTQIKEGKKIIEALVIAGPVRLRPILMTTAAMIFGMLPIAIGHGEGGEARAPMAICVIGGLISSTFLTLVVVPCVFFLVETAKVKISGVFQK
jgi:hydrophobic/amphiphilic exporter-1 (mainly G- bacteria), HAE1 family